jgi:hypothetical protein
MSSIPFTVQEVRTALNSLHKRILEIEHLTPYRNAPPAPGGDANAPNAPPSGADASVEPEEITEHKQALVLATVSFYATCF